MSEKQATALDRCPPQPPIHERPILDKQQAAQLEAIFKILSNATRLRILHALVRQPELSVGALAEAIGMKPQAVSNQLRRLVDRGILAARRDGNHIRYRVVDPCTVGLLEQGFCLAVCVDTCERCGATAAAEPDRRRRDRRRRDPRCQCGGRLMSTLVYMKLLEQSPERYDRGMRMLTLGHIDRLKREIAARWVEPGDEVLDIGCGTGALAALLLDRGGRVTGIDVSDAMLAVARRTAPVAEFLHMTATEIDTLGSERFDRVVATLSLSELSADELRHVLRASAQLLRPGGAFIIADEVSPRRWWQRALGIIVRWPLAALTFVLTRSTTRALLGIERGLMDAGFQVQYEERCLLGTLALLVARKEAAS